MEASGPRRVTPSLSRSIRMRRVLVPAVWWPSQRPPREHRAKQMPNQCLKYAFQGVDDVELGEH